MKMVQMAKSTKYADAPFSEPRLLFLGLTTSETFKRSLK
jgi:hypothetical protein